MQCSTLHYITLRTALLRYCFKKKSVSRHPLSQERCQHKQDLIYFKWSPAVQFSLVMVSIAGVPKFVVTVNSLSLKRLWRHDLHARFFTSLSFSHPCIFPVCLLQNLVSVYSSLPVQLFVHACYITKALEILTGKKLNINLLVFFWVKCKMKYSKTSQGCTSAGFYGNWRAVFSAVVSVRPALCFQPGEEGRVRTVPKGAEQKSGATSPIAVKQNLSAWGGFLSYILYLFFSEGVDAQRRRNL